MKKRKIKDTNKINKFENFCATKKQLLSAAKDEDFRKGPTLLKKWNEKYTQVFQTEAAPGKTFVEMLFQIHEGPVTPVMYYYPIDNSRISAVEIKDEVVLSTILKLFYGIRCIMGHGSATQTLNNPETLKDFPIFNKGTHYLLSHENPDKSININKFKICPKCKNEPCSILKNISLLSDYLDDCIKEYGMKKVLKKSRHFPRTETFGTLSDKTKRKQAASIIEKYKLTCEFIDEKAIDEKYALFHLCRIFHWLKENERMMYVTYRVLLRINQFILVLAHRMRITVAQILMDKYQLPDGIWGVPKSKKELEDKIKKFESKHKKKVEDLQKHDPSRTVLLQVTIPQ